MTAYEAIMDYKNKKKLTWVKMEALTRLSRRAMQRLKTNKPSKHIATMLSQAEFFQEYNVPEVKDYFDI